MKFKQTLTLLFAFFSLSLLANESSDTIDKEFDVESFQHYIDSINNYIDSTNKSFTYKTGTIDLGNDLATLVVPEGFKYLDPAQSKKVLTDLWNNPPAETYGLLFPDTCNPLGSSLTYAVEITYSNDGYIDDEEANDLDYNELLDEMKEDVVKENQFRIEQGYPSIELIGWASTPFYDQENKKLHWAKEFSFDSSDVHTLNYNIRILGRSGYMNLNVIGDMDVLPIVQKDINVILNSTSFNNGNTYSEFNPDYDKVAAVGIGGLIAGKVLAKGGFLVALAKFWKIILVAVGGFFAAFKKKIFGSKDD